VAIQIQHAWHPQFLPKGAADSNNCSTFVTYADDDDATCRTRLKQANRGRACGRHLDGRRLRDELVHRRIVNDMAAVSFIELGGVEARSESILVTDAPYDRGCWSHYKH